MLLARDGSTNEVNRLEQTRQYRIGACKSDAVSQHLVRADHPARPGKQRQAAQGQIDLWATTDPVGPYLAKQEGMSGLDLVLRFDDAQLYLALNKQAPDEVVTRLQNALGEMKGDGALDAIMRRYL